jgi:hypothetical protein
VRESGNERSPPTWEIIGVRGRQEYRVEHSCRKKEQRHGGSEGVS